MYNLDSGVREVSMYSNQVISTALSETKLAIFPLQPENDDNQLEKLAINYQAVDETNAIKSLSEQQLAQWIYYLLKYGVLIASAVVLLGGFLYLIHHGIALADYHFFQETSVELRSPKGVMTAVLAGSDRGIIQLGILLLISTPIARVIISLLTFLWHRDFIYVFVTSVVLAILISSCTLVAN